jgi:uncharacterized lipoprotein YajG
MKFLILPLIATLFLTGCLEQDNKTQQSNIAKQAA